MSCTVKLWGTRGSIPTPQATHLKYGGNTACLEFRAADGDPLIIDAGTGIRMLGQQLGGEVKATLLFTHFHWDHMQGLPFFDPLFSEQAELMLGSIHEQEQLKAILSGLLLAPYHPIGFDRVRAKCTFAQVNKATNIAGFEVHPFALNHPQMATGFRLEHQGVAIVHASDHEHGDSYYDALLKEKAKGADLLIYDAQYTPENYGHNRGRGHSTWLAGVKLAAAAEVKRLVLFHHDPNHTDEQLEILLGKAQSVFPNTLLAREGETLTL